MTGPMYESFFATSEANATAKKISSLEARNARLFAALKAVVASRGRPMRDEWINDASFKDANTIHIHALEAIAAEEKEQEK